MNIADILVEHARARPAHPAIEDGKLTVAYAELGTRVDQAAANLQAAGIGPGDIVVVMLPDSADHLVILCALARAGAVMFSLDASMPPAEFERRLAGVPAKAVVAGARAPRGGAPLRLAVAQLCRRAAQPFAAVDAGDDDPLMLIQSSGTTGAPKSFLRSHAEMRVWIGRYARNQGWTPEERCLSLTQMSFNVGRNVSLGMLHLGATVVVNRARTLDELVTTVRGRRITYLKLTPAHLRPLLHHAGDREPLFPGLRAMVVGSAPTTHEQRVMARKRLTPNLVEQLGVNEAGLLAVAMPADQDAYPDAVGRVVDDVEAEVVDADHRPLPAGEVGLVRFRGPGLPSRYLDDPEATARAFRDGWFYPGDLAALNDEGYLFFKGRADDVINNQGAKFYPSEVENALLAHPQVAEAAVFGWPHTRYGEVAVAVVVTKDTVGEQDLVAFCGRRLARHKLPKIVMFVPEMPRNPMGKIVKTKLKEAVRRSLARRRS